MGDDRLPGARPTRTSFLLGEYTDAMARVLIIRSLLLTITAGGLGCASVAGRGPLAVPSEGPVVREVVRFQSDGLAMVGTLTRPDRPGRHPGLVVVHAAGLEQRDHYREIADSLAGRGIAVFAYDMRGVGESQGNPILPTFQDLAGDARAAVRALRSRSDIDREAVGLWSLSRGGLVAPLVATTDSIAFLIVTSSPGIPVARLDSTAIVNRVRARGLSTAEAEEAGDLYGMGLDVARTGTGYDQLARAFEQARSRTWFPELQIPGLPPANDPSWGRFARNVGYDPDSVWRRVRTPTLVIYGEDDDPVLVSESRRRIVGALRGAGARSKAWIASGADHLIRVRRAGAPEPVFARGFFDVQARWVFAHRPERRGAGVPE